MINTEKSSLVYCNPVAEHLSNLVDHDKCVISDRDDFVNDRTYAESSVKAINAKVSWSQYDSSIIGSLWNQCKHTLFALKEKKIVGYVQCSGTNISYIAVDPTEGCGGVGKNLMFAILAKIAHLGHSFADLNFRSNKENLVYFYNKIATDAGLTKVESSNGFYMNGDPRRKVVYSLQS